MLDDALMLDGTLMLDDTLMLDGTTDFVGTEWGRAIKQPQPHCNPVQPVSQSPISGKRGFRRDGMVSKRPTDLTRMQSRPVPQPRSNAFRGAFSHSPKSIITFLITAQDQNASPTQAQLTDLSCF